MFLPCPNKVYVPAPPRVRTSLASAININPFLTILTSGVDSNALNFVKFPPLINCLCFSLHHHEGQLGSCRETLQRAGTSYIRLANSEQKNTAIGRGCQPGAQQPRAKPTRHRCWTSHGSRGRGQHIAETVDLPGVCPSIPTR